jgi:hypothetical protein
MPFTTDDAVLFSGVDGTLAGLDVSLLFFRRLRALDLAWVSRPETAGAPVRGGRPTPALRALSRGVCPAAAHAPQDSPPRPRRP